MAPPRPPAPLRLRPLTLADEADARAAHAELRADDFDFLLEERPGEPWAAYVERLERLRLGVEVPPDRVPATFLVAEAEGRIVGRVSVRHALNAWLAEFGGHVGYAVRPAFRGRGFATEMLRRALPVAREAGVHAVLVTCDEGNAASAAVIEACGGRFERLTPPDAGRPRKRRYWIVP